MVISEELTGTTEKLTLHARCRLYWSRYNRVRLCVFISVWAVGPGGVKFLSSGSLTTHLYGIHDYRINH